jgi:5-methylcytosine-specific restriction endonuclease McrA
MKKLKRTIKHVDPEFGTVQYAKLRGKNKPEEFRAMPLGKPDKAKRAAAKRRHKEYYAGCPPRPLFYTTTPRLPLTDPERIKLRNEVLSIGRCQMCGSTKNLTLDHIIPLGRGGGWHRENLQCLCGRCNRAKGDSLPAPITAPTRVSSC